MAEMTESKNFIHAFIEEDIAEGGRYAGATVHTRFPPEPNGYLHIGHCKALIIDFGTAEKFGGLCNLRMDDTNPTKEDVEFVEAIKEDIHWLGFDWGWCRPYADCTDRQTFRRCRSRWSAPCSDRCADSRWARAESEYERSDLHTDRLQRYLHR